MLGELVVVLVGVVLVVGITIVVVAAVPGTH